jgi:hypothetical protein
MAKFLIVALFALCLNTLYTVPIHAEDLRGPVKNAIEKSTLDQPGTKPFHLKAIYAPSNERDKDSHRAGEIEIWWQSPTKWRREVRSPEFHQIEIVDGAHQWQKNDGDYFPDWLRELAQAIVRPVPLSTDVLLQRVKSAEVKHMPMVKQTNIEWDKTVGFGDEQSNGKGHIALMDETDLIFYTGGPGWDGLYHDFKDFHGHMIARTVAAGYLEVTAKINVLEELGNIPTGFFDTSAPGGDAQPIETAVLDEAELRQNLLPGKEFSWPPLDQGPLEGVVWTQVVLDRTGKIREMIPPISDNGGLRDAAEQQFRALQFRPILRNGVPVQAIARFSVPFKTVRPAGTETFDSARSYFDHGRKLSCLGAGASAPYVLHAEFQTASSKGTVETGRYEDTWISETQWKREAWLGSSHLVRSQIGDKHYLLSEGPEAGLLRFLMMVVEPIPATDTMTESDWRIRRDTVDGTKTIRVFRGPEGPNGELEPGKSQGYWFDEDGHLIETYTSGMEIRPLNQENYAGVQVARRIKVLKDGKLGMLLIVKDIQPADPLVAKTFVLKGHEWQRAFTAETR